MNPKRSVLYVPRVLAEGDSIVHGVGSTWTGPGGGDCGWRQGVQDAALAAGTPIYMVGPLSNGAALPDPFEEGIPGITIQTILDDGFPAVRMGQYSPDIYLADAGTNDTPDGSATMATRYLTWLNQVLAANTNPALQILAFQILRRTDVPADNVEGVAFNALLPGIVASTTSPNRITIVPQANVVPDIHLIGGLHPDDVGYALLAAFIAPYVIAAAKVVRAT